MSAKNIRRAVKAVFCFILGCAIEITNNSDPHPSVIQGIVGFLLIINGWLVYSDIKDEMT